MPVAIKYVVNEAGQKTSVLVPLAIWESLNEDYQKLKNKLAVFEDIKDGLKEVREAREKGEKLPLLKDLLK